MHVKVEKGAAWLGLATLGVFFGALVIADWLPPLDPSASAEEIARIYAEDQLRIQIGLALLAFLGSLHIPYLALVARQVRRIEGYWGVLSVTEVIMSAMFIATLSFGSVAALTAAYRPERDPELTQALNDFWWLAFVGLAGPFVLQVVILGFAVFIDKRERPSFPRWYGYLTIFYSITACPAGAVYLFKTGPLAWNGAFSFFIAFTSFGLWWILTAFMLVRAVDVEAAERATASAERVWEPAA